MAEVVDEKRAAEIAAALQADMLNQAEFNRLLARLTPSTSVNTPDTRARRASCPGCSGGEAPKVSWSS